MAETYQGPAYPPTLPYPCLVCGSEIPDWRHFGDGTYAGHCPQCGPVGIVATLFGKPRPGAGDA